MAIAKATLAQKTELQRQLNIHAKEVYKIMTQPLDVNSVGAAYDAKVAALEAAIAAVKAAA